MWRRRRSFVSGRGAFYVFVGTLALAQWPLVPEVIVGAWLVALGLAYVCFGRAAALKLDAARGASREPGEARERSACTPTSTLSEVSQLGGATVTTCVGASNVISDSIFQRLPIMYFVRNDQDSHFEFRPLLTKKH